MRKPRPAGNGSVPIFSIHRCVGAWLARARPQVRSNPIDPGADSSAGKPRAHGRRLSSGLLFAIVVLLLAACGGDPGQGPVEVKWDRDACERCRMVLSDRLHSAQVRVPTLDGRSRVYRFDDIGCALIWLEERAERDDPATEIWVNDWRTGDWIDARTATYLRGQVTPMEYGLGAQPEPAPDGLDFAQAKAHILDVEARFNVHGAHLDASQASPGAASDQIPPAQQPRDHAE